MASKTSGSDAVDSKTVESANKVTAYLTEFHLSDHSSDVGKLYDEWVDYDEDLKGVHYISPGVTADIIAEYISTDMHSQAAVMDIACGTGLLGEELQKRGFSVVDGLDPSSKSLDLARVKNVYRRLICNYVTEERLDIDDATYDVVAACGALAPGHLPAVAIHEFLRMAKPGSLICLTGRKNHWDEVPEYKDVMKPLIERLDKENVLKIISMECLPNYYYMHGWKDGIVIKLRKL